MFNRDIDFAPDLIRTQDIEDFASAGMEVTYRPGFHFGEIGFNLRQPITGDVNFRKAIQHCFPRDDLIGTIYKYIVTKVNTIVPPALSEWYWGNVWAHDYNPGDPLTSPAWDGVQGSPTETAVGVLKYGGYNFHDEAPTGSVGPEDWWDDGANPLPTLGLYSPLASVAPTSAESAARLVAEANAIGLNTIEHWPFDFMGYIEKVRDQHDFDMYMIFHSVSPRPTYLYYMLHSSQDVLGGDNWPGVNWPELDDQLEIIMYSLDHDAKVGATRAVQEMMADGSEDQALSNLPFYSRTYYAAQQPELDGMVNMIGYGTDNTWSFLNNRWDTVDGYRPGTAEKLFIYQNGEQPENLNPTFATTVYAWNVMGLCYDTLIDRNPYTLTDEPWMATSWSITEGTFSTPNGTAVAKFHFDLRDDVYWHDDNPAGTRRKFTAEDCVFALRYLYNNQIPTLMPAWENTVYVNKTSDYSFDVYTDEPSQWLIYQYSSYACIFPKHIWSHIQDNPLTPENEILSYILTDHANPTPTWPTLTEFVGTGPFVLTDHDPLVYSDVDANRAYFLETTELESILTEYFHRAGDVNRDGQIVAADLSAIGLAMWTHAGDPLWNADADVTGPVGTPPEGYINIYDLGTCGKFFGETKEVPFP
jgi:peptide/nickel transport system substrate-binding protein